MWSGIPKNKTCHVKMHNFNSHLPATGHGYFKFGFIKTENDAELKAHLKYDDVLNVMQSCLFYFIYL